MGKKRDWAAQGKCFAALEVTCGISAPAPAIPVTAAANCQQSGEPAGHLAEGLARRNWLLAHFHVIYKSRPLFPNEKSKNNQAKKN